MEHFQYFRKYNKKKGIQAYCRGGLRLINAADGNGAAISRTAAAHAGVRKPAALV
ncbi:hypothetical protein [Cupriavidus necator]|uniref:hypothetical protein n=1 Tax=Cupriavidus necator TaxID=106590 RepID=UPI00339D55B1